ncbi:MAG: undecaprenyl-diphosphate phosphatase [Acidobacteria bacterium]|nr:undecaprenyl-diphosphate phosphatase [Acidobacteriota bacterium]
MTLVQAIVLAIVQGVTEFLPISSTAHLVLVPWLVGWTDQGLTFDIALHAGTLVAVLAYFAREWLGMLASLFGGSSAAPGVGRRMLGIIVAATVPGGLAGYFLESYAESIFRSPTLIAAMLIAVAGLMWVADRRRTLLRGTDGITLADGLIIGVAQALAVIPGTSRSGITIAAGLFRNLTREAAARFSFMLATPIIGGAALKKGLEVWQQGLPPGFTPADFLVGFIASALTGYAAIWFLLRYLQVRTLKIFVAYRLVLGAIILAVEFLRSTA